MNRLVSAVLDAFGSNKKSIVDLSGPPAAGDAQTCVSNLIAALIEAKPSQVRSQSKDQYFEAVLQGEQLDVITDILAEALGKSPKPFGENAKFAPAVAVRIAELGGIRKEQSIYLRRFEDGHVAYAALWPWGNPTSVTLKVGVFSQPLD